MIGPVTSMNRRRLVRPLLDGPVPPAGTAAVLDTGPYDPDPSARGLAFAHVEVTTPVGQCPAWHVPAAGDTWVILVHGRGGSRREALRILPALHRAGHPALAITYRNDEEAPASPDGRYHLGDTEWHDLEAAVRLGPRPRAPAGWCCSAGPWARRSSGRSWTGRRRRTRWPRWCGTPRCSTGGRRCAGRPATGGCRPG